MGLELPTVTVLRSKRKEAELVQKFRDKVEGFERKIEDPIHVSDILEPLKGYWQRVSPKRFDDTAILFFNLGYAGHEYLLGQDDEGGTVKDDLCWSPDKREEACIVEVKITTKQRVATTREELDKYLQQLCSYMALEDTLKGEIWVWYVASPGCPQIVVYKVSATKTALDSYKRQVKKRAKELREALTAHDPSSLPLCSRQFCYRSKCQWYDECQPEGRWKPIKIEQSS
jgi:hypothetical protein